MPTAQKAKAIEQARDWYKRSKGVVFADYRGLRVKEMQALRSNLRAKGGEIHVIKNTLFRVAAGDDIASLPYEFHNGPTAVAFFFENEAECTKALLDYGKISKNLTIKGGFFGGKMLDASQVEAFSKLPPRDVLIAQIIGTIVAPLTNLVGLIEALYADPIRTIGAVADKIAGESAKAEAKAQPAPAEAEPEPVPVQQEAPQESTAVTESEAPESEGGAAEPVQQETSAEAEGADAPPEPSAEAE